MTNAEGWFRFLGVAPGIYTVDAMLEGFSTVRHSNVDVQVERTTTLSIQMAAEIIE